MKELTKEQYDQILKELREIRKFLAGKTTKKDIVKAMNEKSSGLKVDEKKVKELVSKGEESLYPKKKKTIWHPKKDLVDEICERIDSASYDAIINAYGIPYTLRRKWWNLITGGNHV